MAADAITLISAACVAAAPNNPLMPSIAPAQIAPIFMTFSLVMAAAAARPVSCQHNASPRQGVAALDGNGSPRNAFRCNIPAALDLGPMMNAPSENSKLIKGATGDWEVVIAMEIHAQVTPQAKLFSGAAPGFGAAPNSQVSLVDA